MSFRAFRRRRARPALIWGAAAFVLAQMALVILAENYVRFRDPLYGDKEVKLKRRINELRSRTTIVMLGSSRTGLAFHGKVVEETTEQITGEKVAAFNFGVPASGPITHLLYLDRMLRSGIKPDILFIELLPSMLANDPNGPIERNWFFADRITADERSTLIRHGFDENKVDKEWRNTVILPWYCLRFQVMTRMAPSWIPWTVRSDWSRGADDWGWGKTERQSITPEEYHEKFERSRREYATLLASLEPGGPAVEALRELLKSCRDQGIKVRLVLMPESSEFRGLYSPESLDRLDRQLKTLECEFHVPLVDARQWLTNSAFNDGHHMFEAGAENFSSRLACEWIAPEFSE